MRAWSFVSTRNPLWRLLGGAMILSILGVTALYVIRGPRPLRPSNDTVPTEGGTRGRFGTVTEPLGKGLFVMSYETITGKEEDLQLQTVTGKLQEPQTTWNLNSPTARKAGGVWTLFGPMDMEATDPGGQVRSMKPTDISTGPLRCRMKFTASK